MNKFLCSLIVYANFQFKSIKTYCLIWIIIVLFFCKSNSIIFFLQLSNLFWVKSSLLWVIMRKTYSDHYQAFQYRCFPIAFLKHSLWTNFSSFYSIYNYSHPNQQIEKTRQVLFPIWFYGSSIFTYKVFADLFQTAPPFSMYLVSVPPGFPYLKFGQISENPVFMRLSELCPIITR